MASRDATGGALGRQGVTCGSVVPESTAVARRGREMALQHGDSTALGRRGSGCAAMMAAGGRRNRDGYMPSSARSRK